MYRKIQLVFELQLMSSIFGYGKTHQRTDGETWLMITSATWVQPKIFGKGEQANNESWVAREN